LRFPTAKEASSREAVNLHTRRKRVVLPLSNDVADFFFEDEINEPIIFRRWPRAPDRKPITPENSLPGKITPNGIQLWGDSILDFYFVHPSPNIVLLESISTGRKLPKWLEANGELDYAQEQMQWAEAENEPRVL